MAALSKKSFLTELNMCEQIIRLEDVVQQETNNEPKNNGRTKVKRKTDDVNLPRGTPKSGRTWKTPKKRFSSIIKTRGYKQANKFEKLQALKKNINRIQNLTRSIVEKKQQEIDKKKERRRKNLKRQEENKLKSEVVQIIKNTTKLKRLKKKQLRRIEKRDTVKKS